MKKRIVALLLAVGMVFTVVGCKKDDKGNNSEDEIEYIDVYESEDSSGSKDLISGDNSQGGNSQGGNNQSGSNQGNGVQGVPDNYQHNSGDKNLEGNTYLSGFPIVKKKEKMTIMAITRSDIGDITNSDFAKTYAKLTNIDIQWQLVSEDAARQRVALALQSGNLPDIVALSSPYVTNDDVVRYGSGGAMKEITKPMLEKWAPNIKATYDKYPEAWKYTTIDGKMYTIAQFFKDYPYGQHMLWVREPWVQKWRAKNGGSGMPKNMNEFKEMLKYFKNDDPNGNGAKDEIPYATWTDSGFVTTPWGILGNKVEVDKNGKVVCAFTTENMKDALTYWNGIYKEGLVDKNTINNWAGDNAAFKTLIAGGKVGAFFWGYPTQLSDNLLKEYKAIPWPTSGTNNGNFPSVAVEAEDVVNPIGFFISKKCKNVPAALRLIDYLYTNDGYMLKYHGNEGGTYTKVNDKTYKMTGKKVEQNKLGPGWTIMARNFLEGATSIEDRALVYQKRDDNNNQMDSIFRSSGQKVIPRALMTKKENQDIKRYSTYFDTLSAKKYAFINGASNLSADWTTLQNDIRAKNLTNYLKAYQAFYDRVNK